MTYFKFLPVVSLVFFMLSCDNKTKNADKYANAE